MAKKRKGRPAAQNVQRHACGKIKREFRSFRGETEVQAMATVIAYRTRAVGAEHAKDSRAGYELGRMAIRGTITARQHSAGVEYAKLVRSYQFAIDAPSPFPASMDLGAVNGISLSEEIDPERRKRVVNWYMKAITALSDAGKRGEIAVRETCVFDYEAKDVDNLKNGLNALAKFFGLTEEPVDDHRKSP